MITEIKSSMEFRSSTGWIRKISWVENDSYNEINAGSLDNYEKILSDLINRQNCKKVSYQRVVYKKRI